MKNTKKTLSILLGCLLCLTLLVQLVGINLSANAAAYSDPSSEWANSEEETSSSKDKTVPSVPSDISSEVTSGSTTSKVPSLPLSEVSSKSTAGSSSLPEKEAATGISPAATTQVSLLFSQIYSGSTVKSYGELLAEGLLQADTTRLLLTFDLPDPTVFPGIPGLPAGIRVDIDLPADPLYTQLSYLAIGPGVTVGDITTSDEGGIGSIVVMGQAETVTLAASTYISADKAITGSAGNYSWVAVPSSQDERTDTVTGVAIGAFDGGVITGALTLSEESGVSTFNAGYMGCVVGAYRNSKVGSIHIKDGVPISTGYVQCVVGANENSISGDISIGYNLSINYANAQFAAIGAASGLPETERKPSRVGVISLQQSSYITGYNNNVPDYYSNVCIGAERGSLAEKIRIEETLAWVQDPINAYNMMYLTNSSRVSIGAYDGATIGTSDTTDAIVMSYISFWDSSYFAGNTLVGASKNAIIKGNISFHVAGLSSSFGEANSYQSVIGCSEGSRVTGTILLDRFVYASSWANPTSLIGPSDVLSSVHEIKVEKFASIRSWNYDAMNYSILGSPGATVDKIWINGDLLIQMPRNTYNTGTFNVQGADFIANEILITNGNIIGQDLGVKYDWEPGSPSENYRNDPDRMNLVPPWLHSDIKMSVAPKNQFGQILEPYTILDPRVPFGEQRIPPVTQPVTVFNTDGGSYTYKYGNDLSSYLALMYGEDLTSEGRLRPSWIPDIYPIWWFDGMVLEDPYVHFVYLPQAEIKPVTFDPVNTGGQIDTSGSSTSVRLNMPLSLSFLESQQKNPVVRITNSATGQQVDSFVLNMENYKKYFTLENSDGVAATSGNKLVLRLIQLAGIQNDTAYTVTIEAASLLAQVATTPGFEIRNSLAKNADTISWQFRIPNPAPPSSSVPPVSSSAPAVSSSVPQASSAAPPASSAASRPSSSQPPPPPVVSSISSRPVASSSRPASSSRASSSSSAVSSSSASASGGGSSAAQVSTIDNGASSSSPGNVDNGDSLTPAQKREETLKQIAEAGVPIFNIGNIQLPLSGGGNRNVWSLFNLILAILGLAASVFALVYYLTKERGKASYKETAADSLSQQKVPFWQNKLVLLWSGISAGALLMLIFIFTQNMRNLMVVFDRWSLLMMIFAAVQTALLIVAFKIGRVAQKQ